jgi:hypothetical protein
LKKEQKEFYPDTDVTLKLYDFNKNPKIRPNVLNPNELGLYVSKHIAPHSSEEQTLFANIRSNLLTFTNTPFTQNDVPYGYAEFLVKLIDALKLNRGYYEFKPANLDFDTELIQSIDALLSNNSKNAQTVVGGKGREYVTHCKRKYKVRVRDGKRGIVRKSTFTPLSAIRGQFRYL